MRTVYINCLTWWYMRVSGAREWPSACDVECRMSTRKDRVGVLTARRNLKMARSAHAYVRGNTLHFYEWLAAEHSKLVPSGPPIWICGDCHVGNLGPIADIKGRVEIAIRDLDQTVIGNPAHDLIRLGLSLATAARGADLPGVTTAIVMEQIVEGYLEALASTHYKEFPKIPKPIRLILKQSYKREWRHLAEERIENVKPSIPLGEKFWKLASDERRAISELFEKPAVRRMVTSLKSREDDAKIEVVDAAYWMKGCSSLGRLRYAILVRVGRKHSGDLCIIDIKEATKPAAPRSPREGMPRDNAVRVVEGASKLSPALGERMLAAKLLGREVFLRELLPQDLKLELNQLSCDDAVAAGRYLASVVGKAHGRQMNAAQRKAWRAKLAQHHTKGVDAPPWLWRSVVDLVASHEAAYLDHCRRYALATRN
jgi:uncharacterized protein (DUF2252 family)